MKKNARGRGRSLRRPEKRLFADAQRFESETCGFLFGALEAAAFGYEAAPVGKLKLHAEDLGVFGTAAGKGQVHGQGMEYGLRGFLKTGLVVLAFAVGTGSGQRLE